MKEEDFYGRDQQYAKEREEKKGSFTSDSNLFRMLPTQDNQEADNRLFFARFKPSNWDLFEGVYPDDHLSFFVRLFCHYVETEGDDGNTMIRKMVLCPVEMDKYILNTVGGNRMFPEDAKCPICKEAQIWWDKYNARREEIGIGRKTAKKMSTEEYKTIANKDETLQSLRAEARKFTHTERVLFVVFDYTKFMGEGDYDEGDEEAEYQIYLGPPTILGDLFTEYKAGYKFYDLESPNVVLVNRNTEGGVMRSKYSVRVEKDPPEFGDEEKEFLSCMEVRSESGEPGIPDIASYVGKWDYNEMADAIGSKEIEEEATTPGKGVDIPDNLGGGSEKEEEKPRGGLRKRGGIATKKEEKKAEETTPKTGGGLRKKRRDWPK